MSKAAFDKIAAGLDEAALVAPYVAEIERLRAALVRIQNWYPISVANPRWTIKEIQEFAHAAREAKGA